jgi:phenylalanyl-tRNA synthetase beta chain
MTELTAGRAAAAPVDAHPAPIEPATIRLRPARTDRLLGISVPAAEQADRLRSIGLGVSEQDGHLDVRVPTARRDLTREVDLVEEVARLVGLDRLRSTVPRGGSGGLERTQLAERALGRALVALGLWEAWTQSLFSERDLDLLGLAGDHPARSLVRLSNPMTEDESAMRTTLLPSLLRSVARNVSHGAPGVALFEIARVYAPSDEVLPHERLTLGIVFSGERAPKAWDAPARRWDFFSAKGVLGAALDALGITGAQYGRASGMPFHPTRAAHVSVDGSSVGALGELHPDVCERFRVPHGAVAAELSLAHLFSALPERPRIQEVWRFPPVYMDLAFVLPADVEAGSVEEAVRAAGLPEVAAVRLFDVYEGEQVPAGRKSLAYALELRAPDRTLTDDEAVRVRDRVIAAISSRFGGELRS